MAGIGSAINYCDRPEYKKALGVEENSNNVKRTEFKISFVLEKPDKSILEDLKP